ncbi:MAG: PucR family transcriptional regulator [Pseudomonadota bacterium]
MTIVITRYFNDPKSVRAATEELLLRRRFSLKIIRVFEDAQTLARDLKAEQVDPSAAAAYAQRMANGGAVLLVLAGYKPLGVAQITRDVAREFGAVDMGDLVEEVYVKEQVRPTLSILDDHPHMMFRPRYPESTTYHMANWPIPLINRRKPYDDSLFPRHARMANIGLPLTIRREPYSESMFPRHARMADFPIPLLSQRKPYRESIFPPHARMANFPIGLISKRKPYTGSLFPRHQRMATVPFPLLINGKTGTNALMPNGPRMANFPIGLLSRRKPFTGSIFSRHARMANFPIPLLSQRKPYTGSAIEPHARMADLFLPLVVKHAEDSEKGSEDSFSFSKWLGLPTISRR